MVPHKWPLTCPTGILSPRGEEEVTFIACEGLLLTCSLAPLRGKGWGKGSGWGYVL